MAPKGGRGGGNDTGISVGPFGAASLSSKEGRGKPPPPAEKSSGAKRDRQGRILPGETLGLQAAPGSCPVPRAAQEPWGAGQPLPEVGLRRPLVTPVNHSTAGRVRRAGTKYHPISDGFKKILSEKRLRSFGTAGRTPRQRGSSGEGEEEEEEEAKNPPPALDPGSQKRFPAVSFSFLLNVCPTFLLV